MTPGPTSVQRPAGFKPRTLLRWLIEVASMQILAAKRTCSRQPPTGTTREALEVVADQAPQLPDLLRGLKDQVEPFVCAGGTPIRTDRVAARHQAG